MTFGPTPSQVVKAVERHVRNSHAIGRLIVDGVLSRISGSRSADEAASTSQTAPDAAAPDRKDAAVGLPLPEAEWRLLSSGDVVSTIDGCDDETVRAIGRYEESHRRRRLVIEAVRRRLDS